MQSNEGRANVAAHVTIGTKAWIARACGQLT